MMQTPGSVVSTRRSSGREREHSAAAAWRGGGPTASSAAAVGLGGRIFLLKQSVAAVQAERDASRLELRPLGGGVGCQVARDGNQDPVSLRAGAPLLVLADARLQHLEGVELRVLANHGEREGIEERFGRMAQRKVARHR